MSAIARMAAEDLTRNERRGREDLRIPSRMVQLIANVGHGQAVNDLQKVTKALSLLMYVVCACMHD